MLIHSCSYYSVGFRDPVPVDWRALKEVFFSCASQMKPADKLAEYMVVRREPAALPLMMTFYIMCTPLESHALAERSVHINPLSYSTFSYFLFRLISLFFILFK